MGGEVSRVTKNVKNVALTIKKDGVVLRTVKKRHLAPAEMEKLVLTKADLMDCKESISIEITEV